MICTIRLFFLKMKFHKKVYLSNYTTSLYFDFILYSQFNYWILLWFKFQKTYKMFLTIINILFKEQIIMNI